MNCSSPPSFQYIAQGPVNAYYITYALFNVGTFLVAVWLAIIQCLSVYITKDDMIDLFRNKKRGTHALLRARLEQVPGPPRNPSFLHDTPQSSPERPDWDADLV